MTASVQALLNAFNELSDAEKHQATVEILRHSLDGDALDIPETSLCQIADELFQALDNSESKHANP